jgi:hypothetical protein
MNQRTSHALAVAAGMVRYHAAQLAHWRRVERAEGGGPKHRAEPLFELVAPEEPRIDLARFLIEERGWPPCSFTVYAVGLFAAAVKRRYMAVRGEEPAWDHGDVYRGYPDWLIVADTYRDEIGAIVEQLTLEGSAR